LDLHILAALLFTKCAKIHL